ncbi:MAG: hypothetical protein J3K34DRAFT_516710, partial [Monoraphidium minutum]
MTQPRRSGAPRACSRPSAPRAAPPARSRPPTRAWPSRCPPRRARARARARAPCRWCCLMAAAWTCLSSPCRRGGHPPDGRLDCRAAGAGLWCGDTCSDNAWLRGVWFGPGPLREPRLGAPRARPGRGRRPSDRPPIALDAPAQRHPFCCKQLV